MVVQRARGEGFVLETICGKCGKIERAYSANNEVLGKLRIEGEEGLCLLCKAKARRLKEFVREKTDTIQMEKY